MALVKDILPISLLFMLIFGFRLPIVYNSAILSLIISLVIILFSKKSLMNLRFILRLSYVWRIFLAIGILFLCAYWPAIYHQTFDTSIREKYIGTGITLAISVFVYGIVLTRLKNKNSFFQFIVVVFLVQSSIQITALLSPGFLSLIQNFQTPNAIEIAGSDYYKGIRGLSLSTEQFFGLSGAYGLTLIFYMKYLLDKGKFTVFDILSYLLLLTASFFVGRTVAVGFLFAIILFVFYGGYRYKIRFVVKAIILLVVSLFIIFYSLPTRIQALTTDVILPVVFDTSENSQSSRSMKSLSHMLSVPISEKTLLVGDGKYMENGHYYRRTDSGYMRQVLYGGIFFIMINFLYLFAYFKYGQLNFSSKNQKRNFYLLVYIIISYLGVLHVKGEVVGAGKMMMILLIMYGLNSIIFYGQERHIS